MKKTRESIGTAINETAERMEEADEAFKALVNNDGSLKKVLVEISK